MTQGKRVLVAGGGIIGIASAYYLRQAGWNVTLFDQKNLGSGCSHANCGYISPSHVFPLCTPDALRQGMQAILKTNGPLTIKPGLNLSLWKWLLKFASHCNEKEMLQTGHALHSILQSSRQLYEGLVSKYQWDCEWQPKGCLFAFADEKKFLHQGHAVDKMEREYGVKFQPLVGQELEKFEPALIPGQTYGAWYFADDAHVRPDKLVKAWGNQLRLMGVEILENCRFERFLKEGNRARGVQTSQGAIEADHVVVAMGALTPFLNRELGYQIPIQPGKGYSITMNRPSVCPERPIIFEQEKVAITPMDSAYRVGSTMELSGYNDKLNPSRLRLLREGAKRYLKEPLGSIVEEEWFGWRPMTPDSKAIMDFTPKFKNVFVAAGHNMLGLSMAPATGKLVAEILGNTTPHINHKPFCYPRQA